MSNIRITFDRRFRSRVLSAFGKQIDTDGYVVDSKTGDHVLSREGEQISGNDFSGVIKGSWIYLKSDILSLIQYAER